MEICFLEDPTENWQPFDSDYLPTFFLTRDRKILRREYLGKITYHLPETYMVITFNDLGTAFHAAYGYAMPDDTTQINAGASSSGNPGC